MQSTHYFYWRQVAGTRARPHAMQLKSCSGPKFVDMLSLSMCRTSLPITCDRRAKSSDRVTGTERDCNMPPDWLSAYDNRTMLRTDPLTS